MSDYNKPKVGDFGFFWDDEQDNVLIYSKLLHIAERVNPEYTYHSKSNIYCKFSKEVPEWFIEKNK